MVRGGFERGGVMLMLVGTSGGGVADVRAFEGLELPFFDLPEPVVTEGTNECILCQTISKRPGLKGADAPP